MAWMAGLIGRKRGGRRVPKSQQSQVQTDSFADFLTVSKFTAGIRGSAPLGSPSLRGLLPQRINSG